MENRNPEILYMVTEENEFTAKVCENNSIEASSIIGSKIIDLDQDGKDEAFEA